MSRILFKDYEVLLREGFRSRVHGFSLFWISFHKTVWKVNVSKRCGNACVRNKEKRRMRDILRGFELDSPRLVLLVSTRPLGMSYDEKKKYCWSFLRKAFSSR